MSSKVNVPFFIPTSNQWEFLLLHILVCIWWCSVLYFDHSNRCVGISCFNFHFPDGIWWKHLFICLLVICISFLVRCLLRSLTPFFKIGLFSYCWILRILCIIWIIILYQMYILKIPFPSLWLTFSSS